jgi:hypothetical protein
VSTQLEIVNKALSLLGEGLLTSGQLTTPDDSKSRVVVATLPAAKNAVLRASSPQCARKYNALVLALPEPNNPDFLYAFDLPSDCLRVIRVLATDEPVAEWYGAPIIRRWRVAGRYLLCDIDTVAIEYTADIDWAAFDPLLEDAVVHYLAWKLSGPLTDASSGTIGFWRELYESSVALAQGIDEAEGQIDRVTSPSTLISYRFGS